MTTHAEAIKTLEKMPYAYWLGQDEQEAIRAAIDAMKVVEWLEKRNDGAGMHIMFNHCWILNGSGFMVCEAPTLSELATKLKGTP